MSPEVVNSKQGNFADCSFLFSSIKAVKPKTTSEPNKCSNCGRRGKVVPQGNEVQQRVSFSPTEHNSDICQLLAAQSSAILKVQIWLGVLHLARWTSSELRWSQLPGEYAWASLLYSPVPGNFPLKMKPSPLFQEARELVKGFQSQDFYSSFDF